MKRLRHLLAGLAITAATAARASAGSSARGLKCRFMCPDVMGLEDEWWGPGR